MSKDEALRLALEALKTIDEAMPFPVAKLAQSAIKQALAQSEQEPVGKFAKFTDGVWREVTDGSPGVLLYTAPPQRELVGLTEDEPVAYYHPHKGFYWAKPTRISAPTAVDVKPLPLYTTLPQRTWVGLTGVEVNHVFASNVGYPERMIKAVENLLKEKNNG